MLKAKDIKFDDQSGDLFINPATGDFEIVESDTRHVQDIIESYVGWWKQFPLMGAGIRLAQSATGSVQRTSRRIKIHLISDGYKVEKIAIKDEKVYVTGERKNVNL